MRWTRCFTAALLLLAGCWVSADEHVQACSSDADCADGFSCYADFCVQDTGAAGALADDCTAGSQLESCYEGPSDTEDVGACHAGQRVCINGAYTDCLGQALPQTEVCNGKDDDCDGDVDDVAATSGCDTHLQGACAQGTLVCRAGVEFCQPEQESQTESCNGADDDCDGTVDEVVAAPCYPEDVLGCVLDSQGSWQCQGRCSAGTLDCSGAEQTCADAMTPVEELCTSGDDFAQDENCDGEIDEDCPCDDGDTRACYSGPADTSHHGICRPGTQTCVGIEWGDCTGQVTPRAETCDNANADDDCNDVVDDVPGLGTPCVASGEDGACRDGTLTCVADEPLPRCVGASPTSEQCDDIDQDCDGDPTNGFDLTSDATCGACDVQCSSSSELCCGAACIQRSLLEVDEANCGACGNTCGAGQYCCQGDCLIKATMMMVPCDCPSSCGSLACCGMTCRNLQSDKDNCGACGLKCGRGKTCVEGVCQST